jgi:predicted helicase
MIDSTLRNYLTHVESYYKLENATEHSYRPPLQDLLKSLTAGITVLNEPQRAAYGAPDYAVLRETGQGSLTIGYIETKRIGTSLDQIEQSEQMDRYLHALDNLVLTDYLEFRWYVKSEKRMVARLALVPQGKSLILNTMGMQATRDLLYSFLEHSAETIRKPEELAKRMARTAHMIRDIAVKAFAKQEASSTMNGLFEAFNMVLLPNLAHEQFADMFAQTLAYGLFAARYNHKGIKPFNRDDAAREIPRTNPFLRDFFATINTKLDEEPFIGFVDELTQVLATTDMEAVLADFGKRTHRQDPLIHFYETFLAQYDPKLRELRGVYYTPEPIVSYIVRSVDHLLQNYFDCPDGLADISTVSRSNTDERGNVRQEHAPRVLLLDPACGTGTFLYAIVDYIREVYRKQGNTGMWSGYVRQHLLPRLFGFELLMAPYAVAHLKLGMQLAALDLPAAERSDWAYDFKTHERLGLYLTNALDQTPGRAKLLLGGFISDEANEAARVKQDYPVMVVLGNPPYSGHSANKGGWIVDLLETYKEGHPELKKPAQAKWLSDDYVKFMRFAQWRIEQTGYGILAFVTNHSYLDNPTFRGMRQSLMQSFDDIYVLDLHGNSKKKERGPEDAKDENVFDIQQGVAISIFVKWRRGSNSSHMATVYHAHLWGPREIYAPGDRQQTGLVGGKYHWLGEHDLSTTSWTKLQPQAPLYLFTPRDTQFLAEYELGWRVPDIFRPNGDPAPGIVTTHDDFAISWTQAEAIKKVEALLSTRTEDEARQLFQLCTQNQWQYAWAKKELSGARWREETVQILYRPFDTRWTVFNRHVAVHRRERVMRHMLAGNNIGITIGRAGQVIDQQEWNIVFCTRFITEFNLYRRGGNFLFPLYLYPDDTKTTLFNFDQQSHAGDRRTNLEPTFISDFAAKLELSWIADGYGDRQQTFGPEDILAYLYAVFHSPTYRTRYADFLKVDFPRVPLTSKKGLFWDLCELGSQLIQLHLLEKSGKVLPAYPVRGNDLVGKVEYVTSNETGRPAGVFINKEQYFAGVSRKAWDFRIGGYQICQKWLKDRKDSVLSFADIQQYGRIVAALEETILLMERIDSVIELHGGWPLT